MIYVTPAEFEDEMKKIANTDDPETSHVAADELMRKVLIAHGYEAGVKIFENMRKWYA